MKEFINFPNPPIVEALLDIRVALSSNTDLNKLASFQESIKDQFPLKQEKIRWEAGIKVEKGTVPQLITEKNDPYGYLFSSPDKKMVVQARLDGFTFSRVKSYNSWEDLRDISIDLWGHYLKISEPLKITRVALRYINQIMIPLPISDFKDYILTIPEMAPGIPQGLTTFFMRLVAPEPGTNNVAIITQEMKPDPINCKSIPLTFDIDVFREVNLKPDDKEIWSILESLREYKNTIFFNSITKLTAEMFK